jgi:ketosteroid isomerase-like protein
VAGTGALVRRAYDALERRDLEQLTALVVPDFELDLTERVLNPATYRGTEGMQRFVGELEELWASMETRVESMHERDEQALAVVNVTLTGRGSGVGLDERVAQHWRAREGKLLALRLRIDRDAALTEFLDGSLVHVLDELRAAWAVGDRERVELLSHPDVEVDMRVRVMNPEVYRGYEGLAQLAADMGELWEYGDSEVQRTLERDDEALVVLTTPMRGRGSGIEFVEPVAQRYRFEDGRVLRMTLLTDVDRAIADFDAGRPARARGE